MKGVLHFLKASVLLVTLLCTTFIASNATNLTDPLCSTVEGSGKKYQICLTDVSYDDNAGTSTWTYKATTLAGNDISHFVFGIPCGTTSTNYTNTTGCGSVAYGNDPTTNVNGIKFDCGAGSGGRTVSFTIKGIYSIGLINYAIKTGGSGTKTFVFEGYGPSCATLPSLPVGTACENAVTYLQSYGLITIDDLNTNSDVHYNVFVGRNLIKYPGGGDFLGPDGVFTQATQRSLEVAGQVMSGANLKYSGAFSPSPTNTIVKTNATQYKVNGYSYNLNTSGAKLFYDYTLADKAAKIKSDLEAASAKLGTATANNTTSGNLTFNVNTVDANGIAVFNIASTDIAQNATVQVNNTANANTIVINVSGTNVNWASGVNVNINQNLWSKVLWNFPNATNISVSSLKGIVLAPKAVFTSNSANEGSIAVKTYNGNGEIHRPYFAGNFSTLCEAPAGTISPLCVTEGDTYAMDFDTDENGNPLSAGTGIGNSGSLSQPYANLFGLGEGMIFASGNEAQKPLTLYDSEETNGDDPDLERNDNNDGNWAFGNLANTILGNLLIINETSNPANPNDNAKGGEILSIATMQLQSFSFDIVDLENVQSDDQIIFENTETNESATILLSEFLSGSGSQFATPGVAYGDRSANRITNITASKLGISSFNKITFDTDDSFGIGSICVEKAVIPAGITLNVKVLLGGATNPNQCVMTNALQAQGVLPTTSPYCVSEIVYPQINDVNGPAGIITDWVLVEIRDGNNPSSILEVQSGLLQKSGNIVGVDGQPLTFSNFDSPIYIVVKHRNHLTISSPKISIYSGDTYDFTTHLSKAFGNTSMQLLDCGKYGMWPGDVNGDMKVTDNKNPSDAQKAIQMVLCYPDNPFPGAPSFIPPTNTYAIEYVYSRYDVNLDGYIKDNALPSDVQIVKNTILNHPNNPFPGAPSFVPPSNTFIINTSLPFITSETCLNYDDLDHIDEGVVIPTEPILEIAQHRNLLEEIRIFPNPNYTPEATIELQDVETEENATIFITNMNGQIIQSQRASLVQGFNKISVETGNLPNGIYLIKIIGTQQNYQPIQLIKANR